MARAAGYLQARFRRASNLPASTGRWVCLADRQTPRPLKPHEQPESNPRIPLVATGRFYRTPDRRRLGRSRTDRARQKSTDRGRGHGHPLALHHLHRTRDRLVRQRDAVRHAHQAGAQRCAREHRCHHFRFHGGPRALHRRRDRAIRRQRLRRAHDGKRQPGRQLRVSRIQPDRQRQPQLFPLVHPERHLQRRAHRFREGVQFAHLWRGRARRPGRRLHEAPASAEFRHGDRLLQQRGRLPLHARLQPQAAPHGRGPRQRRAPAGENVSERLRLQIRGRDARGRLAAVSPYIDPHRGRTGEIRQPARLRRHQCLGAVRPRPRL